MLGKGAMGLIYDALDPKLDRRVAIKTILTRTLDEATARHYSMRFKREVRAVARLNHRNIVQVYDFGNEGDLAYIVMEYIKGRELKDYFAAKERFDLKTILLMIELLDALECAHEAGVIHRGALHRARRRPRGDARRHHPRHSVLHVAGADPGPADRPAQRPLLGRVLFYQLLAGQKPFEGTQWALAKKIVQDDPVWPSALVQIPAVFDQVVSRALAKAPEQRYPNARSFAEALRRIAAGKPLDAADQAMVRAASIGSEAEAEFWAGVKDSDDAEEVELYIEQFPQGAFVELARQKIAALRGKKN